MRLTRVLSTHGRVNVVGLFDDAGWRGCNFSRTGKLGHSHCTIHRASNVLNYTEPEKKRTHTKKHHKEISSSKNTYIDQAELEAGNKL